MIEFFETSNLLGLLTGLFTFLVIGIFHPVVVKAEYYFGVRCWWVFLFLGLAGIAASIYIQELFWSSLCGVIAFSSFWTILEVFEQRTRVKKGWFPMNPKRKADYEDKV